MKGLNAKPAEGRGDVCVRRVLSALLSFSLFCHIPACPAPEQGKIIGGDNYRKGRPCRDREQSFKIELLKRQIAKYRYAIHRTADEEKRRRIEKEIIRLGEEVRKLEQECR